MYLKRTVVCLVALLLASTADLPAQVLQSPASFLGYGIGERFTPHHRILSYVEHCAAVVPGKVKLIRYGQSNEGRDLVLAVLSDESNMARLEDIRRNNLRLSGKLTDGPGDPSMPAVIWLSYNVHGNESSSSEVSMQLLYDLLSGKRSSAEWLKKVVVIIDPCLNPDGRERYVQWYNQQVGRKFNADPLSREHDEPWPGGRTNHYYFDLNRDWAWQTQVETRQRVAEYFRWMPVIHSDYHEQYPDNPYYFAPAAEPFHEAITAWQRDFQHSIGKNHARYFDANGWLYFTREYFDLFYPSYGDTYPTFNGSIGMTFEQAGHGMAGLAIRTGAGDTLRLADRIAHHLETSFSTIEITAQNARKVNEEFRKYFDDCLKNGSGQYAGYLVSGSNTPRLKELKQLLNKNQLSWKEVKPGQTVKAYDYFTGKDEARLTAAGDILISMKQPAGNLARVLFEPFSSLADSVTYDITAWALPYAYGIRAQAIKDKLPETIQATESPLAVQQKSAYAYLLPYRSFSDARLMARLLMSGIRLRFTEKDIQYNGKEYPKGSLLMLVAENSGRHEQFLGLLSAENAGAVPVSTGFMDKGFDIGSDKVHVLKAPSVAILSGEETIPESLGEVWHMFDRELEYPASLLNSRNIGDINLSAYQVIVVPEGDYKFLSDKEASANVKGWVKQGGRLVVIGRTVGQFASGDWGVRLKKTEPEKPEEKSPGYENLRKYGNRERDQLADFIPGAIYRVELDQTHPVAFGYQDDYFTLKQNGDLLEFLKEGWNVGVIKKEKQVAGFVGNRLRNDMKDGTIIAVQPLGRGTITYFTDNPLFRSFWQNGKQLFLNAVFLTGQ